MKKITQLMIISLFFYSTVKSQDIIMDYLIATSDELKNDTEKLIEGYFSPLGGWYGTGLNSGWYNTGKPHQFPGFDITFGIHFIKPPESAASFTPNVDNLFGSSNGAPISELPTFIGDGTNVPIFYQDPGGQLVELFQAPGGGNIRTDDVWPMPYLQGSIGLIKKTEILFRFTPKIDVEELTMRYWGIGIKHDIKQWVPGISELPFDLSFVGGYSNLNSSLELDQDGQELIFDVKAFNSNIVLSKKLSVFTPYLGVGYQYAKSFLDLKGDYVILDWNGNEIIEGEDFTVSDPFSFSFGGVNGFKATTGARLKLFLFTIHVEYTMAEYNTFTFGIGLNSDIGSKLIGD
tara:strand:- start:443 stop:1483 length:1041 start_codon:yes stop_codon:yes gene_type:complete